MDGKTDDVSHLKTLLKCDNIICPGLLVHCFKTPGNVYAILQIRAV